MFINSFVRWRRNSPLKALRFATLHSGRCKSGRPAASMHKYQSLPLCRLHALHRWQINQSSTSLFDICKDKHKSSCPIKIMCQSSLGISPIAFVLRSHAETTTRVARRRQSDDGLRSDRSWSRSTSARLLASSSHAGAAVRRRCNLSRSALAVFGRITLRKRHCDRRRTDGGEGEPRSAALPPQVKRDLAAGEVSNGT